MTAVPVWAEKLRRAYLAGESSVFVLHVNVFDTVLSGDEFYDVPAYLSHVFLKDSKDTVVVYTPVTGVSIQRASAVRRSAIAKLDTHKAPGVVLPFLEAIIFEQDSTAVIIPYADMLAPAGDTNTLNEQDRGSLVRLHRWSLSGDLAARDNIVILLTDKLSELHPKLVANPRVTTIEIPLPDLAQRTEVIQRCNESLSPELVTRLATHSAGLKNMQIRALIQPRTNDVDEAERRSFILKLLTGEPNAAERAAKLATITRGMDQPDIRKLIRPEAADPPADEDAPLLKLFTQRKREIIERECAGLIEFIDPKHDMSAVGGIPEIKQELLDVAAAVKSGDRTRCPMGLLFVGAMGCGKTFVANAFVKESGLPGIRLKNFRSKWQGTTESNLEVVLYTIRALGPIVLIVDEGDRAMADEGAESDGGTGSRVIGRLKEFMSDPENRGVVLVIIMTNRPDKLDTDMKRAGRLDKKIPFFYPEQAKDVEAVLMSVYRRHGIQTEVDFEKERDVTSAKLLGYSNADLEAVALMSHDIALRGAFPKVGAKELIQATQDYIPSRDSDMIEYMELLAAFEASRRSMLPQKLRNMSTDHLNEELKRARIATQF